MLTDLNPEPSLEMEIGHDDVCNWSWEIAEKFLSSVFNSST